MHIPDTFTLREATWINLARQPCTEAARSLTGAVADLVIPALQRTRPLGVKGRAALLDDVGIVLAGLLRPGFKGSPVRASSSPSGALWASSGLPMGRDRFWTITSAMQAAGLVECQAGVQTPDDGVGHGGLATALWPSAKLDALAAQHGVTAETRKLDWQADASTPARPETVPDQKLVTCRQVEGLVQRLTPSMQQELDECRAQVRAINAENARHDIRGAGRSITLRRRFLHSPAFGGRFYAPVTTLAPEERGRVTFDGVAAAEVDLRASQFSLLLGLAGWRAVPPDPYAFDALSRNAVKTWIIQTLGGGKPAGRWSPKAARPDASVAAVKRAVLPRYPELGRMIEMVPAGLLADVPDGEKGMMAGQWLTGIEAGVIAAVLEDLTGQGIPALQCFDSVLVPVTASDIAARSLSDRFAAAAGGLRPHLTVTAAGVEAPWHDPLPAAAE